MILVIRLNLSLLASIFVIFIVSVITPSKIIIFKQLYYPLLTFVSHSTLSFFVVGCFFVKVSRRVGSCRVMRNIARLIIRVVMFITFVTLFVCFSTKISMLPLIFTIMHELIVPFLSIGCAGCSIFYKQKYYCCLLDHFFHSLLNLFILLTQFYILVIC